MRIKAEIVEKVGGKKERIDFCAYTWLSLKYVENPRPTEHLNLISVGSTPKLLYYSLDTIVFVQSF